jgi:hypothetical protein
MIHAYMLTLASSDLQKAAFFSATDVYVIPGFSLPEVLADF